MPDVIVIMMGANDFAIGQPVDDGPAALPDFEKAYGDFVLLLRSHAPSAHIFLAASPSVTDGEPAGRQSRTSILATHDAIVAAQAKVGDTRVYAVAPTLAIPAELVGCDGHGTPAFHQRVALELAVNIRAKTGW